MRLARRVATTRRALFLSSFTTPDKAEGLRNPGFGFIPVKTGGSRTAPTGSVAHPDWFAPFVRRDNPPWLSPAPFRIPATAPSPVTDDM